MTLRIALIGHAFMGSVHSYAWRNAASVADLPLALDMRVLCGSDEVRTRSAAERLGWAEWSCDWREVITRDDIDLVDVCTPGNLHEEIATAALQAGKHVLCEKPLANDLEGARRMAAAARVAVPTGAVAMAGFNYRRVPALRLAHDMARDGRLGVIRHVRVRYLQDWLIDPQVPLVWRLQSKISGSGALGDLGSHIIDAAYFVTGQTLTTVQALERTFIEERPLATGSSGLAGTTGAGLGRVDVDDAVLAIGTMSGGALMTLEATRFAQGRKNAMEIEVNGDAGSIIFAFESMNELLFLDATQPSAERGFRKILATEPEHPYMHQWWPPGHVLGYDHTFTNQMVDLVQAIASGVQARPSFDDALDVQKALDAIHRAAGAGTTVQVA